MEGVVLELLFGVFLLRDIGHGTRHAIRFFVVIPHRQPSAEDIAILAVLMAQAMLILKLRRQPQKVGEIRLALKKTDVKRNKFTMNVLADDKTVEKKDKNVNEPVQFYASGARTPYEVVVNEIRKDQVIGYLAVPKVKTMAKR